jgi:hypothetical protein
LNRKQILDDAANAVLRDRAATHGKPENSFGDIAKLWGVFLDREIEPWQVAIMLGLLKVARAKGNPKNPDNWSDLAGYAACGGELAESSNPSYHISGLMRPKADNAKRYADHPTTVSVSYFNKDLEEERTLYVEDHTEIEKRGIIEDFIRMPNPCSEKEAREFGKSYIKEKRSLVPL